MYTKANDKGVPRSLASLFPTTINSEYDREPFDFNMNCFICTETLCPSQEANETKNKIKRRILYKMKNETTQADIVKALKKYETQQNLVVSHPLVGKLGTSSEVSYYFSKLHYNNTS